MTVPAEIKTMMHDQMNYVYSNGGYLGIKEADDILNDSNREIIEKYKELFPDAVMGKYTGDGDIFKKPEGRLYNFCCDFVLPGPDKDVEANVLKWREKTDYIALNNAINAIGKAGGQILIWT